MQLQEIHPSLQKALGYHEALRRLGFLSSNIFVHLENQELFVALVQDKKQAVLIPVGEYERERDTLVSEWGQVSEAVINNKLSDDDIFKCVDIVIPNVKTGHILTSALVNAGIRIPGRHSN